MLSLLSKRSLKSDVLSLSVANSRDLCNLFYTFIGLIYLFYTFIGPKSRFKKVIFQNLVFLKTGVL